MKAALLTVKILVLLSGATTVILRFISYKYAEALSADTLGLFSRVSIVSAAVLVTAGAVWILLEKRREKSGKSE